MKPKAELLLHWFMFSAQRSTQLTFRNWMDVRSCKEKSRGTTRHLRTLEREKLLERLEGAHSNTTLYRITEKGRLTALGGRDPERQWNRYWDGLWRFLIFTIPEKERLYRVRLRTQLRRHHFGCMQRSVWVSPDCLQLSREELQGLGVHSEHFSLVEGLPAMPVSGQKSRSLVAKSWNFSTINQAWEQLSRHLDVLDTLPRLDDYLNLVHWFKKQFLYWRSVALIDPLLPTCLLPPNYKGIETWDYRKSVMKSFARRINYYF